MANNIYVPPKLPTGDWNLQDASMGGDCSADGNLQEQYAAETLEISGAPVNVFRLLGVHEQGKLVDLTELGYPLSSGSDPSYDAANAFNVAPIGWRSIQKGMDVMTTPSYIGYNFGTKKTTAGSEKYNPTAPVRHQITTLKLQQSDNADNRALQIRVERSDDGIKWHRVDVVNVPNTNKMETINLRGSVPSAFWRIIPTMFAGIGNADAYWEVVKLEMMDFEATSIDNIEDLFFMENRDREYATASVQLKCHYQPFDSMGDLSKFGFNLMEQYTFTCSFAKMVEILGRPIVIGDIIEIPNEMQYDHHLRKVKKFLEVTDAGWSSEGYTTGWKPILYRFQGVQLLPSAENRDVIKAAGDSLPTTTDDQTDNDFFSGMFQVDKSAQRASENIKAEASDAVPETGIDSSTVASGESAHAVGGYDGRDYGVEDALPPNNLPYTEGYALPDIENANDGEYFRLNYPEDKKMPSRLYQYSAFKHKWMYLESDRRQSYSSFKPSMRAMMESANRKNLKDI